MIGNISMLFEYNTYFVWEGETMVDNTNTNNKKRLSNETIVDSILIKIETVSGLHPMAIAMELVLTKSISFWSQSI